AGFFDRLPGRRRPEWYAASDPPGRPLGSGGGTAHLLTQAWRDTSQQPFAKWLETSRKLIIHGGGQSRRLPAYAPPGKLMMPLPVFRWTRGQRIDQTLLDLQTPDYERVLAHAPVGYRVMITSGDVLLRFSRELPSFPEVDVLGLGMWVAPEVAKDFGVFFSPRQNPQEIAFFLQKPSIARIRELNTEYFPLVDTGMWLLSARAVRVLFELCGWDPDRESFPDGVPATYDLYAQFGLALGTRAHAPHPRIAELSAAVIPLPRAEFYHLGTSRQLVETVSRIQSLELDESKIGLMGARQYPSQFLQNCRFTYPLSLDTNHTLWVENSVVPTSWHLASEHVLTGVPDNDWSLRLERGVCLDIVLVDQRGYALRVYGLDDPFRGPMGDPATRWLGQSVGQWFERRDLNLARAGIAPETDIQSAPLFPVEPSGQIDPEFLAWLFTAQPAAAANARFADAWCKMERLSAADLCQRINLERYFNVQAQRRRECVLPMMRNARFSVFYKLDLEATA
ncbi:MAG TPA: L-fucokinase, partial [Bacillota bacterium]|nr:L-fucokinase [Bacillota bacterium]